MIKIVFGLSWVDYLRFNLHTVKCSNLPQTDRGMFIYVHMHILVIPSPHPDIEHLQHPRWFPHALSKSVNTYPQQSKDYFDFYHYRLVLPVLELYL